MHDIPILMLHSVNSQRVENPMGRLSVSPEGLEAYLKAFRKWHYQVISLTELLEGEFDANRNYIVLTFDDGYKDNLTVARPILEKYHAHATIFVNPGYCGEKSDPSSDWGFMTWDEVKEAEKSGVFDIQAHTMTHEFIFVSDRVIDYYTPEKFDRYYWLAWMLFPESPHHWDSGAYTYKDKIPTGFPVFEFGRRVSSRKFIPDQDYVAFLIDTFQEKKISGSEYHGEHGRFEEEEEYRRCITWEIAECKHLLESNLQKRITSLCFPGSGYTDFALQQAEKFGYKCYMIGSKLRTGNNYEHLEAIRRNQFDGFNRMTFPRRYLPFLPNTVADEWMVKISLGTFQKKPLYMFLQKALSQVRHR